jgi:hypothetical protein
MEAQLMADKKWPEDYPTHIQVPPNTAKPLSQKLFRMVGNDVPILDDFVPSNKDPLQSHMIKQTRFRNSPGYYGTSFSYDKQKLTNVINGSPNKFGKKKVAAGLITKDMGVGDEDGKSHVTIWFYENVFPLGFELI